KFGIPLIETYGLSEAASQVTANPVPPGRHKPGSAGLPVGVALRICRPRADGDEDLHDVPRGETGEICISGPSVISAYYGNAVNGEQVVAYIVVNGPWSPELAQKLHEYAAQKLSAHKVPVDFIAVDALPKSALGKVEHRLLQKRDAQRQRPLVGETVK